MRSPFLQDLFDAEATASKTLLQQVQKFQIFLPAKNKNYKICKLQKLWSCSKYQIKILLKGEFNEGIINLKIKFATRQNQASESSLIHQIYLADIFKD